MIQKRSKGCWQTVSPMRNNRYVKIGQSVPIKQMSAEPSPEESNSAACCI